MSETATHMIQKNNTHTRHSVWCVLACLSLVALAPLAAEAQIVPHIAPGGTTITLTPASPRPGERFEARVEAYSYDLSRADIRWTIGGTPREEYAGKHAIELTAPALGVPLPISARVSESSGAVRTAAVTVVPSTLDLIVESRTQVPYFYRGRALPSPGSAVRLLAMPALYTRGGTPASRETLIYTWRVNSETRASGRGQYAIETIMPDSSVLVEVTAETLDGSARHTAIQRIEPAEPKNLFYEDNPLYGLSPNALPSEFTLLEDEISIRAEPYYVSRDIFRNAKYEWTVGGAPVQNPNTDPAVLTLRKTGERGATSVGFSIRNLSSLLQAASSALTVYFE